MSEQYIFFGTVFDVDKALELVANKEVEDISVEQVQKLAPQIISHYKDPDGNIVDDLKPGMTGSLHMGTYIENKQWALEHADLEKPVIWFHSPNFSMLIDGYHRLYRAWKEKRPLKVKVISTQEEAKMIVVDWVSKVSPVIRWFKKEEVTCPVGN